MNIKTKSKRATSWKADLARDRIQKSAFALFAKKGFAATSTRMIAGKAKLNLSLIARYFGGKEQLFKHIVQVETEKVIKRDLTYTAKDTPREEVREYIQSLFRHLEANIDFYRIVVSQSLVDPKFSKFLKESVLPQEDPRLRARLERLGGNGSDL